MEHHKGEHKMNKWFGHHYRPTSVRMLWFRVWPPNDCWILFNNFNLPMLYWWNVNGETFIRCNQSLIYKWLHVHVCACRYVHMNHSIEIQYESVTRILFKFIPFVNIHERSNSWKFQLHICYQLYFMII